MNAITASLDGEARETSPRTAGQPDSMRDDTPRSSPRVSLDEELYLGGKRARLVAIQDSSEREYTFLIIGTITHIEQASVRVVDPERILIEGGRPHAGPEVLVGVSTPFVSRISVARDIARLLHSGGPVFDRIAARQTPALPDAPTDLRRSFVMPEAKACGAKQIRERRLTGPIGTAAMRKPRRTESWQPA
jgi:hypothetical protein